MGQYERRFEERGVPAGQQTRGVPPEQQAREQELVEHVAASFGAASDARLKQLMQALTRHLHAFLREVRLTEDEWRHAIAFLTDAGTFPTTGARNSSCCPTSSAPRCRRSRSTTQHPCPTS
jgi:hypothetical protein